MLYPNPANSSIYIRHVRPIATQMTVTIIDIMGRIRRDSIPMVFKNTYFDITIDVSDLPQGHYFVRLSDGYRPKTARFLKR